MQDYNLELEKVAEKINKEKANTVLIQLPDGLKPRAKEIKEELKKKTNATLFFWADTCFGSCDIPLETEKLGIDLIIQFGHSEWQ